MDGHRIKEKCRKVFIPLADKRIFTAGRHDNQEFEFVSVFRKEADATRTLDSRQQQRAFDKPEKMLVQHSVEAFYLVPAKALENAKSSPKNPLSTGG